MSKTAIFDYQAELQSIESQGLLKMERVITSPQSAEIQLEDGRTVLNFCANNYLGLADSPAVIQAAKDALDSHGFGMASVRFICGTQDLHKTLEAKIAAYFGTEDAILYAACFDANGGLFEPLLGENDAVISDALNHASIIDGVRLCKAKRFRYANCDMADLEAQLQAAAGCRIKMITTDGVFSMDGTVAPLAAITALAEKYDALVHIDECHATGFLGATGRGSAEVSGVLDKIDIFTGTLGKSLGGAVGGFTTGPKAVIELLRQRSRPYLFSNSLPPPVVAAGIKVFDMLAGDDAEALRSTLRDNTAYFRERMGSAGFDLKPGAHPIVPVMLHDAPLAQEFAKRLLDEGIYAVGFFFPVVAKGQARIRTQMSAAHSRDHLDKAIAAFTKVGRELGVIQ